MDDCTSGSLVQQAQCALAPVADKLGQGAKYAWAAYYKQTIIVGVIELALAILLSVLVVVGCMMVARHGRKFMATASKGSYSWGSYKSSQFVLTLVPGVIAFGASIAAILLFADGLPHLVNPAYYTIHQIIGEIL